jgi:hypothetical protein
MIEVYAFLAIFPVQILALSVLFPVLLIRYARVQVQRTPAERFAKIYPGIDVAQSLKRLTTLVSVPNAIVAVLGLGLWAWLIDYMQSADWSQGKVKMLVVLSFVAQAFAICLVAAIAFASQWKALRNYSPEGKRTAVLQRRGLFDFVSPFAVIVAALAYLLFAAYMVYLQQRGWPLKPALITIGAVTGVYVLDALTLYVLLYKSRMLNPMETQENRGRWIGFQVKGIVYSCIFIVAFLALFITLQAQKMPRWEPFALSALFVGCSFSFFTSLAAAPRQPEADALRPSAASGS